jgi:hypothetical protein
MPGPGTVILAKEFKKPITIAMVALIVIVIVAIVRFMRRDKRKAKQEAKAQQQELILLEEKNKTVYEQAAATFDIQISSARICDSVAMNINGAFGSGLFGNDDEQTIIRELNRLAGPKTIACADFFFKKYNRKPNPNIAFDSLNTLNRFEWGKIKEDLKGPLKAHAKKKGNLSFDWYFYNGN